MYYSFAELDKLTDEYTDPKIIRITGLTRKQLQSRRFALGVKSFREKQVILKLEQYPFSTIDDLTDRFSDGECAKKLGWAKGTFIKHRIRLGVKTFQEKTGLIKVNGIAMTKQQRAISQQDNATAAAIKATSGKSRPKCRKHFFDEDFFETIDTEEKAYFLGLLIADGCIEDHRTLSIGLKASDQQILKDFYMAVRKNAELEHQPRHFDDSFGYEAEDRKRARLHSVKMIKDLANLGVSRAKTFSSVYPKIPRELDRHCIRGINDGDGSVSRNGVVDISACRTLVDTLCPVLESHGFCFREYPNKTIWRLVIPKRTGICEWLYRNSSVYLERKYLSAKNHW